MSLYELLDTRTKENMYKANWLYELLEVRIQEFAHLDALWRLLHLRIRK